MSAPGTEPGLDTGSAEQVRSSRSPGAVLLAERRSQGLSLGDIARQLKLSVRQVEALERDEYGSFSGSVFVRGFLRNYAKLLRLDADSLLQAAGESIAPVRVTEPPSPQMPMASPNQEGRRRVLTWGAFGVLAVVVLFLLASKEQREPAERSLVPTVPAAGPAETPSPAVSQAPSAATAPTEPVPAAESVTAGAASSAPREQSESQVAAESTPSRGPIEDSPQARNGLGEEPVPAKPRVLVSGSGASQIRMVFEDESWVEVRDGSGDTIFARLNAPGTERLIRGQPPFVVVVGNAHAVKLLYRGKSIDLGPHTRVDVARVTLE
jgi:cytoskeleton protein RodZ